MTLYRKYRPQTIDELDLASVRKQLRNLAESLDKLPHAFLFAGPRGTGKTSAARILAKIINCENPVRTENGIEPCNKCEQCKSITNGQSMDIIEIDAASSRGIDDIRALRENIALAPANAKRKIYIMDEAHMLTTEAANAFLKTLEEPPSHAIFILATTDPGKLPETVRSRLTLVSFKKANSEEVGRQLARVVAGEKLEMDDEVISLISARADGSFRDAVKLVESLALVGEKITKELAQEFIYGGSGIKASDLLNLVVNKKTGEALLLLNNYSNSGGQTKDLIDQLQEVLREEILILAREEKGETGLNLEKAISLSKLLMDARGNLGKTAIPELALELVLIEWIGSEVSPSVSATSQAPTPSKKKASSSEVKIDSAIDSDAWRKVLDQTKAKNATLEAVLRSTKPLGIDGNTINLAVYYRFHKERLEVDQYRRLIEDILGEVMGIGAARLVCTLEDPPPQMLASPKVSTNGLTVSRDKDILEAAKEIFGE